MNVKATKKLVSMLGNLLSTVNELAIKVTAAERVFRRQDPALFDEYVKETDSALKRFDPSGISQSLKALEEEMHRG